MASPSPGRGQDFTCESSGPMVQWRCPSHRSDDRGEAQGLPSALNRSGSWEASPAMHNVPFQPLVTRWFIERFEHPTPPQAAGWGHISRGADTLIAAPTGSGKTLAAFLWSIDRLVTRGLSGSLADRV